MNKRIAALLLALAAPLCSAQEPSGPGNVKAARAAMLERLPQGKRVDIRGEHYRQLPEVLAVERGARGSPEEAVAALGASAADIIETKGRLVVFRSSQKKQGFVERVAGTTVYPTLLNMRTGAIGVLTGTLIVKPRNMADADAIAAGHALQKIKAYPQLGTVFYRAGGKADIADVAAALAADPRVESAHPEIIERVRVPR